MLIAATFLQKVYRVILYFRHGLWYTMIGCMHIHPWLVAEKPSLTTSQRQAMGHKVSAVNNNWLGKHAVTVDNDPFIFQHGVYHLKQST